MIDDDVDDVDVTGNTERLVLYTVIAVCLGVVALLLTVIVYLRHCRHRSRGHHRLLHISSTNSDKKSTTRRLLSSTSTQTTPENTSLLPPDSPDQSWVGSPTPAAGWGHSPDGTSPRMADGSSSPSTLRSLPLRIQSGPATVGGDPVWSVPHWTGRDHEVRTPGCTRTRTAMTLTGRLIRVQSRLGNNRTTSAL